MTLGGQDGTRLAATSGVSDCFVAVGGLASFFAARGAILATASGSAGMSRSRADQITCKTLMFPARSRRGLGEGYCRVDLLWPSPNVVNVNT